MHKYCREIDEALRPGVYALIDACSADDLQHIHTVFGGNKQISNAIFLDSGLWVTNQTFFSLTFLTGPFDFVEGPCRSTLGSLQNDYKLNFQYEGKV